MPYLNIVFHNVRGGGAGRINQSNGLINYAVKFVAQMNVYQTHNLNGPLSYNGGWGECVTGWPGTPNTASGIFFCESQPYGLYVGWNQAIPTFNFGFTGSGFAPYTSLKALCAFLEGEKENSAIGAPNQVDLRPSSVGWVGTRSLRCLGTGVSELVGSEKAPFGSDRYGILFQAAYRTYPNGDRIEGVFVHTKNTEADPGTQIVALCRRFPDAIVFGDLNFDLRRPMNYEALSYAVGATHEILAIQNTADANQYYCTHYVSNTIGTGCLDYALVPKAQIGKVELWAYRPPPPQNGDPIPTLFTNDSDHSVMMLRICCK